MTEIPIEQRVRDVSTVKETNALHKELDSIWWEATIEGNKHKLDRVTALRDELKENSKYFVDLYAPKPHPPARGGPMESATLVGGKTLRAHAAGTCAGYWCCIHRPSPHHMTSWAQEWDESRMFRVCPHGQAHPDPDDFVSYDTLISLTQHKSFCDGCCTNPYFDKDLL
jgi:hypothetical protein